jgi:hypothetical protein
VGIFGLGGWALGGLSAGAAGGLALAGALALTSLYLLKLRRRRVVVPFAQLWIPQAGDRRSERWARRLRRWLSLAVQLLLFGLILLAAADPQPAAADRAGRSVVILIDRSASMSAADEPETRLGAARIRARALVDGLGAADRALVASFATGVIAESGFESDGARLRRAIAAVGPSEEPGDLPRALAFAAAVLRGRPRPTVILVSDGAFSEDARRAADPALAAVDLRYAPVGRRARNVGILAFAARRYPADPSTVEAALTLQNFGPAPAPVTVEVTAGADRLPVERVRLTLAPGERRRHLLPDVAAPDARLEARLLHAAPGDDDLTLDDRTYAVVPARPRLRVLRIGPPNLYLDGALLSLGEGVVVRRAPAAAAETTRASWPRYDVVIFDGLAPAPVPDAGRFLYLEPRGAGSPFGDRGVLRDPLIAETKRGHALLRHLDLADVNIAEARRFALAPGDVAVAGSFGTPLIAARERAGLRVAALAFDVRRSDLPMRAAFPLLVANALAWLAGGEGGAAATGGADGAAATAQTGTSARVAVPRGAAALEVRDPTGTRAAWPVAGDVAEVPITRAGFYTVGTQTIGANLADAIESATAPAAKLTLGGRALAPPDPPAARRGRPVAMVALLLATALLLLEWWSYHRRWTV